MQFSLMKSTMPLSYVTIAPGDGQAFRQPGSSQCMQPSLRISHSRLPCVGSTSKNFITVQLLGVRSTGLTYTPTLWPTSSRRSSQFMQATWQALQPRHLDSSISLAICGELRTDELGVVVAERATTFWGLVPAMVLSLGLLDVDQEGLELRRLRVRVADVRSE